MTDRHLVVADCETSGLRDIDVCVEVAWHDLDTDQRGRFVPVHDVMWVLACGEPEALNINGYRDRLAGAEQDARGEGAAALRAALDGNSLAGSNPAFDARHLERVLGAAPWHHRLVDLASYAAGRLGLNPRATPGLAAVCDALDVPPPDHTATRDVTATVACFRALQAMPAALNPAPERGGPARSAPGSPTLHSPGGAMSDPLGPQHAAADPTVGTSDVETIGASPKAVAATAVATVLGVVLALLNALNTDAGAGLLGGLNPTVQAIILFAVPPLITGVTTYMAAVGRVALKG